jgi:pimeloyl-ACP methyl ester carboxylesterase
VRVRLLCVVVAAATLPARVHAAECSSDLARLDRGERRPVLICGADIAPDVEVRGLEGTGIAIGYRQHLRRCSLEDNGPGLYLWLEAAADARPAALELRSPGGAHYCQDMPIAVEPRRLAGPAALHATEEPGRYRLEVRGAGLESACREGLRFPPDPWSPTLALRPGSTPACDARGLRAEVVLRGSQRMPSRALLGDGALAWVPAPVPPWAGTLRPEQAKFVDVGGYRTRYFEAGGGPDTVILVHGGQPDPVSPTAESWRQNVAALAREFRVIAYDALGSGLTEAPRDEATYRRFYEAVADHLLGLIRALGIRRAHLVGSSQGGWPVLRLALDHPDLVKCAVSVDTVMAPFTRDAPGLAVFAYTLNHVHPASGPTAESLLRERRTVAYGWNNLDPQEVAERMQFVRLGKLEEAKAALARLQMSPGHPAFRSLREAALAELAGGRLTVPHLVVWGYDDRLATIAQGLEFFRIASASPAPTELWVVNQAGHIPQAEHPDAFNRAVIGFCGRYRAR